MENDLFNYAVTIYSSYIDEESKTKKYSKKYIYDTLIFERDSSTMDTTGVKSNRDMSVIIPCTNTTYINDYIPPKEYVGQENKFTLKCGDYILSGTGKDFIDIDNLKKDKYVYQITQVDLKTYGKTPHLFIGGVK